MVWQSVISGIIGGGLFSSLIALLALTQIIRRNTREAFFKCLDGYFKVMEYRSKATNDNKCYAYFDYYRALFDLQWSEYQMWLRNSIPDKPYRVCIEMRHSQYGKEYYGYKSENGENTASYRIAWERLLKESYYNTNDPFVAHMKLLHEGKFDDAMNEKYAKHKFKFMAKLYKRLNR